MTQRRNPNARKRAATNVVMFIGLGALALVAWYDINGKLPDRRASVSHTVDSLTLVRGDGQTFAFKRDGAAWQILQPVRAPADASRVEKLVALIDADTQNGYAIDEINLDATGLAAPQIRMRLGADTAVFFGGIEPVSNRRYVQIDDTVVLLDDQHAPLIEGGLNAFVDRRPFRAATGSSSPDDSTASPEAWATLSALGVRPHDRSTPTDAIAFSISTPDEKQAWHAWREGALIALHRSDSDHRYLISAADAATLGLSL